jgi:hypothetical protein
LPLAVYQPAPPRPCSRWSVQQSDAAARACPRR